MHGQKTLTRNILTLAWPAIATNITTPLLSLVDVAVTGHIGNSVLIGAIAVGATMFNTLYWLFGFLRMGTSGMTAQAFGAKDYRGTKVILRNAMGMALVAALMLIALSTSLGAIIIRFLGANGDTLVPAQEYFQIAILGAPGVLVTYVLSGWFLGMQDSKPILYMALVTNILNISLNFYFVFGLHMQLKGVAMATAISQWMGALCGLTILLARQRKLLRKEQATTVDKTVFSFRRFFKVNSDIFLRTLCLIAVTVWFTHTGAGYGNEVLAANSLIMQLFMLFSYFMDGFAYAGEALTGRYHGAKDYVSLHKVIKELMRIGVWTSLVVAVLYFVASDNIMRLLTDDSKTLAVAHDYRMWIVIVPFAGFMSFLWDGIYIGMTKTRGMLLSMAIAMIVFYLTYFSLAGQMGNHALWLAFVLYLFARGIVQGALFKKDKERQHP